MEDIIMGPRTSAVRLLTEHLNTAIPEMALADRLCREGDIESAQHTFAEYVRSYLKPEKLIHGWLCAPDEGVLERLQAEADDIRDYRFVSCGIPHRFSDRRVDWLSNPTYNSYCEWPWQLSRHRELDILAECYAHTRDESLAVLWVELLDSWLAQALLPEDGTAGNKTVCWRTIEAGIRMEGWSRQLHAFIHSPALTDAFVVRYFASIFEHGHRLSTAYTGGNWLLMEMHGLLRISELYPFLRESAGWRELSLSKLGEQIDEQFYPDGFQYELSTCYHGVAEYTYYQIYRIYRDMGMTPPDFLEKNLERMYGVYPLLSRPDGRLPDINDGDPMHIGERMDRASALFPRRDDFLWFATDGREGRAPRVTSYAFPYSGAAVMRTGWDRDAIYAYMDCSPFGKAHQHEDKLNVILAAYGRTMINEAGNYDYDTSEMRKYVLDTRSHNTVRIDGKGQNRRSTYKWQPEHISKRANMDFITTDEADLARAEYSEGYGGDLDPTVHERRLIFFKRPPHGLPPFFAVVDRLTAPDDRRRSYEAIWHLEDCEFSLGAHSAHGGFGGGLGIDMLFSDTTASVVNMMGQYEPYYQGWFPIRPSGPHEHRRVPTPVLCGEFEGAHRTVTLLCPYSGGQSVVAGVLASADVTSTDFTVVLKDGGSVTFSENFG